MPLSNENMRFTIKIYLFFLNVIQKMIHLKRTFQNWKTILPSWGNPHGLLG